MRNDEARFWSKVDKSGECWVWAAGRSPKGYGRFLSARKTHAAHRWIYEWLHGPQPRHIEVCHRCDNPSCVRPEHLFAGTKSDNMQDCARKGRNVMQRRPDVVRRQVERAKLFVCRGEAQGNSKLTAEQVADIRRRFASGERSTSIANDYRIHPGHVRKVARGAAWAHVKETG